MKNVKILSSLFLAAAVALPAIAMAQDDHRDDHKMEQRHDDKERGAGPDHSWHRGDAIPQQYRDNRYVVSDWRGHHLSAPPSGYHWVQVNGDFVLAAVATGVIADVLLSQ
jgi:Ni/Co efflux regulator RcnB